ncbi:MAG: hypothetical protein HEQ16_04770 [Bosea sp.]|nr:hypothetical protein [Bosea sp. (in: a-proteobacteria)]
MSATLRALVAAVLLILSPLAALAHEPRKGPNGGALVDAGSYHIEVIGKGATLDVLVSDLNDKPLPATGFKALAILVVDGKTHRVTLEPTPDGSRLTGTTPVALQAVKGAVQLTDHAGKTATGRVN